MKITEVKALGGYRLHVVFDDGVCGIVDLSDYAGVGVFQAWLRPGIFEQVVITPDGALVWPGDLDLCPDAIYLRVTGKSAEEVFPALRGGFARCFIWLKIATSCRLHWPHV